MSDAFQERPKELDDEDELVLAFRRLQARFERMVAALDNHERRISALEKRAG
jgi:hypothetical protein